MKKIKWSGAFLLVLLLITAVLCVPAFAVTESEVEAQVAASSKESVAGNVLIWFLCAVAFLKVSQKVDSFMASMGVNVGHTGGSMLSEAMLTFRTVTMAAEGVGHPFGGGRRGSGSAGVSGKSGSAESGGFFKGGLVGMASRKITNDAVKTATSRTEAIHTAQKQGVAGVVRSTSEKQSSTSAHTASTVHSGTTVHTGGFTRTDSQTRTDRTTPQEGVIYTKNDVPPAAPIQTDGSSRKEIPVPGGTSPLGPVPPPDSTNPLGPVPPADSTNPLGPVPPADSTNPLGPVPPTDNTNPLDPVPPADSVHIPASESQHTDSGVIQTEQQADRVSHQEGVIQTGHEQIVHDSSKTARSEAVRTDSVRQSGGREQHTTTHSRTVERSWGGVSSTTPVPTLGGKIFSNSLQSGGQFANDVIGMVARGDMRTTGSITGDLAVQSLQSYMGYTALGDTASEKVVYSEVEIGGGRITGREITPEHPQGIEFAMYHVDQYSKPEGDFQKVFSADGAQWYKQHAIDTVVKTPFKAPDGEIDYHKEIVKRLPTPPKRKDRM